MLSCSTLHNMSEENKDNQILRLVNPEFDFEFGGKQYKLRKATLDKAIQYQQKMKELDKDIAADLKIIAFCIYVMLKDKDPDITENFVLENTPADADALLILTTLGFISPSKMETAKKIQELVMNRLSGERSSSSLPAELDGVLTKSES